MLGYHGDLTPLPFPFSLFFFLLNTQYLVGLDEHSVGYMNGRHFEKRTVVLYFFPTQCEGIPSTLYPALFPVSISFTFNRM